MITLTFKKFMSDKYEEGNYSICKKPTQLLRVRCILRFDLFAVRLGLYRIRLDTMFSKPTTRDNRQPDQESLALKNKLKLSDVINAKSKKLLC